MVISLNFKSPYGISRIEDFPTMDNLRRLKTGYNSPFLSLLDDLFRNQTVRFRPLHVLHVKGTDLSFLCRGWANGLFLTFLAEFDLFTLSEVYYSGHVE